MDDQLPQGWTLGAAGLGKAFQFRDFKEAIGFVLEVADRAEKANHHPDIDIRWNLVNLALMTHSEKRVTDNDYRMAETINAILPDAVRRRASQIFP